MQDNYTDLSFNLGLRKLAGIRSIAPAVQVYDPVTWSDTIYLVQKDKLVYLFGCEMTPLESDCIKIEYVSGSNVLVKPYVPQTSFIVSNVSEVDSNGATDYYSTSISGSPTMKRTKLNNESSFKYYANLDNTNGNELVVEEFDTATGTSELILDNTYSPQNPTKINNYNFCRSFKFLVDGYYIITLDESKSALYNNIDTDYPISNPDSSNNYNQYKSTTRGPWSPTTYGTMKHGEFLKRQIIVHCVDGTNNPDLQTYEDSPINFNLNNQSLSDGNTNDDIVAGITLRTLTTVLKSPNLLISRFSYDGTEPAYSSMGFCIDPTKANTELTAMFTDTNIAVGVLVPVYNLRNRIFDSLVFSGSADFVKQEISAGLSKTTDMRNSTFKNCKFTNITFGSPDGRQLLLDGSSFINCKFENCKFIVSPRNMLIKNCTIDSRSNMNGFFECKGSDGNLFIDLKIKNCSHPFVFDNSNFNNINNLVYNTSMYVSAGISNTCSFLKVVSDSTSGTFTGNLILKNTIQNSIGNPIVIESTASLNLFAFNNLESAGSIKLGKLADEKILWAASWFPSKYLSNMITPMYLTGGRLSAGTTLSQTITEPTSAISFLSNVPEDRRVILAYHLGASFSDQYWLSQGTKLDSTYNIIDACKDSNGNYVVGDTLDPRETASPTSYGGSQRFISPWYDNQSAVVKSSWSTWLNSFKTSGGTAKYFIGDIQEGGSPVGFFSDYIRQNSTDSGNRFNQTHFSHIINDPRSSNSSVGNSSIYGTLQHQLKLDSTNSTYTLSDFASLSATELALGSKGGYKLWDFVTGRLAAYYVNDSFYAPISSKFPLAKVSNYENITITENEEISNSNGHRAYYDNNIGNAVAPELYGEIAFAGTVYEIDPTNTTRLIYNPSPTTPFGINAWNSLLLTQQKLRSITRNKGQKDLHVWLASVNFVTQNAFGGLSDPLHDAYWLENVYHTAMHNPDLILYFNHNSTVVDDQKMHDALTTINTKTFNGIQEELSTNSNKINFDTNILISGCYTRKDENLWRISVNNNINTIIIDNVTYSATTTKGIWYTTDKNISELETINYNSTTKTIVLQSKSYVENKDALQFIIEIGGGIQDQTKWNTLGNTTISLYSGNRINDNLGATSLSRAYNFEQNPASETVGSPWHNIIYEKVYPLYEWGARSFFINFPIGGFSNNYNNNKWCGTEGLISYIRLKEKYTVSNHTNHVYSDSNGNIPDYACPARWKGLKESLNALITGKMNPTNTVRPAITEPCNVTVYLPGFMGWPVYREESSWYWDNLAGTSAQKDSLFYTMIDNFVNELIYIQENNKTSTSGKLRICFDSSGPSATPNTINLYRTISRKTSCGLFTHGGSYKYNFSIGNTFGNEQLYEASDGNYRSDALELADWYLINKLSEANIEVYHEARLVSSLSQVLQNNDNTPFGCYQGSVSTPKIKEKISNNLISNEFWLWRSATYSDHMSNYNVKNIFRYVSNGIENIISTEDPYGTLMSIKFTEGSIYTRNLNNWTGPNLVYSPFFCAYHLYALIDNFKFRNTLKQNLLFNDEVKLTTNNIITVDSSLFAMNASSPFANDSTSDITKYYIAPKERDTTYRPLFNSATFKSNPSTYSDGLWTTEQITYWDSTFGNLNSFNDLCTILNTASDTVYPKNTKGKNSNEIYPNDIYTTNILKGFI